MASHQVQAYPATWILGTVHPTFAGGLDSRLDLTGLDLTRKGEDQNTYGTSSFPSHGNTLTGAPTDSRPSISHHHICTQIQQAKDRTLCIFHLSSPCIPSHPISSSLSFHPAKSCPTQHPQQSEARPRNTTLPSRLFRLLSSPLDSTRESPTSPRTYHPRAQPFSSQQSAPCPCQPSPFPISVSSIHLFTPLLTAWSTAEHLGSD